MPIYWTGRSSSRRTVTWSSSVSDQRLRRRRRHSRLLGPVQSIDMIDIELSCGLPPGPDFADLAVLAEELGYARVWIFDLRRYGMTHSSTLR